MLRNGKELQRGSGAITWIALICIVGIVVWQIYLGATVQKIGIPNIFMIELGAKPPPPPPPAHMSDLEVGIDRSGSDYKDFMAADISECLNECASDKRCKAVSFNTASRQCWMKSDYAMRTDNQSFTSAVKVGD